MRGDLLDILLIAAALVFAISGYRQGFVVGLLSFVGFIGGGLLGTHVATPVSKVISGVPAPAVGLLTVLILASLGQFAATVLGHRMRARIRGRPARYLDNAAGAGLSVVSLLLISWLLGSAIVQSAYPTLAQQVRRSAVLRSVDALVPGELRTLGTALFRLVDQSGFPVVFGALGAERIVAVQPPDRAVLTSPAVRRARTEVLKIVGAAASCDRTIEGSGFVYASGRVMTNAHVVAGVSRPTVQQDSLVLDATVVLFDPRRDVAVLAVPGLVGTPLSFAGRAGHDDSALVAGYPEDGPFDVEAARVRALVKATGFDIYQRQAVTREIYSIRSLVRFGNSGGPLLAPNGSVYGVVFAKAADDSQTGYALTADEVAGDARAGTAASIAVDTGGCA